MGAGSRPNDKTTFGDNIWLAVDCDDTSEQDRMFNAIAQGGNIVMPLDNTFWGARFGMIKDKYGIGWMFNCELKK
jgi:PhnB protein